MLYVHTKYYKRGVSPLHLKSETYRGYSPLKATCSRSWWTEKSTPATTTRVAACVRVNVGSAADAQVRLPWAAPEHMKIYPLHGSHGGNFTVSIHDPAGMTHKTTEWWGKPKTVQHYPDPPWKVYMYGRDSMTIRGHVIQVINFCGTCGKEGKELWQCTCGTRRT